MAICIVDLPKKRVGYGGATVDAVRKMIRWRSGERGTFAVHRNLLTNIFPHKITIFQISRSPPQLANHFFST